jgi:glyoxylase-like metal-dependent hydrolase (beta-lactamase superfamily II)/8-oxo-dGTP pyrophosphatase MutT (NUDIX family)
MRTGDGVTASARVAPLRAPGAGLIIRDHAGAVLVGARTARARSWPGTLAFPGGAVDADDAAVPLATRCPPAEHAARVAALREAIEEVGAFFVAHADGTAPTAATVDRLHAALVDGAPLAAALAHAPPAGAPHLVLDDRQLVSLSSWETLEGSFVVQRFLTPARAIGARRAPLTAELDDVRFRDPREVLAAWTGGRAWLLPPIRDMLERLVDVVDHRDDDPAITARLRGPVRDADRCRRDLSPGVVFLDARTPTLWPATHTNTPVLGSGDVLLVDPATPWDDERSRFDGLLATVLDGDRVVGIVLTHHHHDHVGDVARLRAKHGCPVYAHAATAARVDFAVDVVVDDGHVFDLPAGRRGPARRFVAVHTPGHAPGHLCLWEPDIGLLIAGDMIAGTGSILIDPPEGHMATYLRSLQRLATLEPRALIPAHGPLLVDGAARIRQQHAHRVARAVAVAAAIEAGAADVDAVVAAVYGADTQPAMLPFAARSVAAIVEQLIEEGRVVDDDGVWRTAGP